MRFGKRKVKHIRKVAHLENLNITFFPDQKRYMVVDSVRANKSFGLHQYMWGYEEIFVYLPLISIENWDPLVDPTLVVQKINGCDKWIAKST